MKKKRILNATDIDLPEVGIEVKKSKGHAPVIMMYVPAVDSDGDYDLYNECVITHLSNRQYKLWRKGNVLDKLMIALEAYKEAIEINEIHKAHY